MKNWALLFLCLFHARASVLGIGTCPVELSSNLNGGSACPNQPVRLQCKAYSSSLQEWVFPPFIPVRNPVTFDASSAEGVPVIRNDNGLMIEANATDITEVANGVANITSTLSFYATADVDGTTVQCINEAGSPTVAVNDSIRILVKDSVVLPAGFSCASTAVNCGQSNVEYQCSWSQVIDAFNLTVSDSAGSVYPETTFGTDDDIYSVTFPVPCGSSVTITVTGFRLCNSSTESVPNITQYSASCDEVCSGLSGGEIAGIVIGVVIVMVIIIVVVLVSFIRNRRPIYNVISKSGKPRQRANTNVTVIEMDSQSKSLFLIKPDIAETKGTEIMEKLKQRDLRIVVHEKRVLTEKEVKELYHHKSDEEYYQELVTFMTSGPSIVVVVEKSNTGEELIEELRDLVGPTDSEATDLEATKENGVRQLYGTDLIKNAVHTSDSPDSATRELKVFFPDLDEQGWVPGDTERTLAIIRPDTPLFYRESTLKKIEEEDFKIVKKLHVKMSKSEAQVFYKHCHGQDYFDQLCEHMSSGEMIVLVLEKKKAASVWRALLGPPVDADKVAPDSLRAQIPAEGCANAIHGAETPEKAKEEFDFICKIARGNM